MDTVTTLFNANQRPSAGQVSSRVTGHCNFLQEGTVLRIGFMENYESAVYVSVKGIGEPMKVEASIAPNASASTCTGNWNPYFVGDRVLIAFLYGDASRPVIVGRCYDLHGNSEYLLQEELPIPQRGAKSPSGHIVRPSPLVLDPQHLNTAGMATINVSPMVVI